MDNQRENIPENADKLLFAEDIVSYVMTDLLNRPYHGTRAMPHREFVHNAFNENVKAAVKGLSTRLLLMYSNFFRTVTEFRDPNEANFLYFEQGLSFCRSSEGFDAKGFLFYCVQVAIVASIFRDKGLKGAPDMAVSRICESLKDYDMLSGGWDSLNDLASVVAGVYQDSLPPSSSTRMSESTDIGHLLRCTSSLEEMDSAPLDNAHYAAAAKEMKDEDKSPVNDSANSFTVHKIMDSENLHSPCSSTRSEQLQPSGALQIVKEDTLQSEKERQDETEKHDVDFKGALNNSENMEDENLQLPSLCENLEDLKICEAESASNTIRNVQLSVVEAKDTSTVDEQADSCYPPKCLEELEEPDNVQISDSREKCEKGNVSEDGSMLVASGGESKTSAFCHLRGSASEIEVQDGKTRSSSN